MLRLLAVVLALPGCIGIESSSCEEEVVVLEDDDVFGDLGVSAADVLAVMEGTHAFAGAYADGGAATGAATVTRGAGDVIGVDRTVVTEIRNGGFGIGVVSYGLALRCDDTIAVPVDIALRTDDGLVDVSLVGEGEAVLNPDPEGPGVGLLQAGGDIAAEDIVAMPEPRVGDPVAGLALQWTPSRFDFVSLWWDGKKYQQVLEATPAE